MRQELKVWVILNKSCFFAEVLVDKKKKKSFLSAHPNLIIEIKVLRKRGKRYRVEIHVKTKWPLLHTLVFCAVQQQGGLERGWIKKRRMRQSCCRAEAY